MKNHWLLLFIMIISTKMTFATYSTFIGFDTIICAQPMTNIYSYSNYTLSIHTQGYNIYKNGNLILHDQQYNAPSYVYDLIFIDDSTGFLVTAGGSGASVVRKTSDGGITWNFIGYSAWYMGLYIVNANYGYLVAYFDSTVLLTRISDLQPHTEIMRDTFPDIDMFVSDTILNNSLCGRDYLNFYVKQNLDTVKYHIGIFTRPTAITDLSSPQHSLSIYPNPSSGNVRIQIPVDLYWSSVTISIFNSIGKKVKEKFIHPGPSSVDYSLGDLPKGLYFIQLSDGGTNYSNRVLVE